MLMAFTQQVQCLNPQVLIFMARWVTNSKQQRESDFASVLHFNMVMNARNGKSRHTPSVNFTSTYLTLAARVIFYSLLVLAPEINYRPFCHITSGGHDTALGMSGQRHCCGILWRWEICHVLDTTRRLWGNSIFTRTSWGEFHLSWTNGESMITHDVTLVCVPHRFTLVFVELLKIWWSCDFHLNCESETHWPKCCLRIAEFVALVTNSVCRQLD